VLEVLAELGLVGLALLLLFFATGLRRIDYARLQRDPLLLCVVMLLALHLVAAMVKSNLAGQQQLFFTVGLLALRPHSAASAAASRA
jgi:O-antigen ligase